jgi:hypothetical protein
MQGSVSYMASKSIRTKFIFYNVYSPSCLYHSSPLLSFDKSIGCCSGICSLMHVPTSFLQQWCLVVCKFETLYLNVVRCALWPATFGPFSFAHRPDRDRSSTSQLSSCQQCPLFEWRVLPCRQNVALALSYTCTVNVQ